ncbi:GT-D fold domain-containing glycosyltransferase [Lactiplantibacillus plantarum]|uniref:GT-D fold domain-containing glycosyltransferase n=1 Tax=Lactiplantibacillus plantarum TaxID=1590 RepID=UPI0022372896|nr:GT-D fold domain-containing glycosyltransferase [Lactiplantibacillus plantarum]MCW6140240.1 GT-D fold domain-containing protein [Lactiplantibacillus plantarum]
MKEIISKFFKLKGLLFFKDLIRSFFYFHIDGALNSKIRVLSIYESIEIIKNEHISISRFGDGEIRWMLNTKKFDSFQRSDEMLSRDLKETFLTDTNNLKIALPALPCRNSSYTMTEKIIWKSFWVKYGYAVLKYVPDKRVFLNAAITRPYMPFKKNRNESVMEIFKALESLWSDKRVLIVEGSTTRFALGNDFLSNARTVNRIICPSHNAYESINEILETTLRESLKLQSDIILVALGPTATVLVEKLVKCGIWTIDIGHADLEYSWYKLGATKKIGITGKEVNEVTKKKQKTLILEPNLEQEYLKSQVAIVS